MPTRPLEGPFCLGVAMVIQFYPLLWYAVILIHPDLAGRDESGHWGALILPCLLPACLPLWRAHACARRG